MKLFGHGARPPFPFIIGQNENFVKRKRTTDKKWQVQTGDLSYNGRENRRQRPHFEKEESAVPVVCTEEGRVLRAELSGELDHHGARAVMEELDRQIDLALPRELVLDLSGLTFTDSSGMIHIRGAIKIVNTPDQAARVFRAAGLQRMLRFE